MDKLLHYKDIGLVPRYSELDSRSKASTQIDFLDWKFKLPIVPANMACTMDFKLASQLALDNYFYIMHRFISYDELFNWIRNNDTYHLISFSIGIQEQDFKFIERLAAESFQIDIITIDVAHAFHKNVEWMITAIKSKLPKTKIIAGNVAGDFDSIRFLEESGADAIKVGLSYGAGCTTYAKTGFCSPMFSAGLKARAATQLPLIGDGSISCHGDITKGLRAGFDMIMAGSMFAACTDSPAPFIQGKKHYFGSASERNKGHKNHIEGKELLLDCNNMTYLEKLDEIKQDLQSSISYAGGKDLSALKTVEYFQL